MAGQLLQLSKNRDCGLFLKTLTKGGILAMSHSFLWCFSDEGKPHGHVDIFNLLKPCPVGRINHASSQCRNVDDVCAGLVEVWADYVLGC